MNLVAYVWMYIARLSHAGRVCSGVGDYESYSIEEKDQFGNLEERGSFIMFWLIFSWIIIGLLCLLVICAAAAGR